MFFAVVGGGDNDSLLLSQPGPQSPRLLTELFHLPQKFAFVDLDLEAISAVCKPACKRIALHIVLPNYNPHLRAANTENLRLGCTPAINIFPLPADPIRLDGRSVAYPVLTKRPGCKIYSIEKVAVAKSSGDEVVPPFHGTEHSTAGPYWQLDEEEGFAIRFVDREQNPVKLETGTITVQLTCTSSDPLHGAAKLTTEANTMGFPMRFLSAISASSLSTDHVQLTESLCTEDTTLSALIRQLQLHGCKFTESLKGLVAKPITAWLEHPMGRVHMHGTEFTILIDESALQEHSIYIFGEILAATLADKLRENRFAQIRIANGIGQLLHCAKPHIGTRPLL